MPFPHSVIPGVYSQVSDNTITPESTNSAVGGMVITSNRGPIGTASDPLTLVTSPRQFIDLYGNPEPAVSKSLYCALHFLDKSNQLYVRRVINDAKNAAVDIAIASHSASSIAISGGVEETDATNDNLGSNVSFRVLANNPGVWANSYKVNVKDISGSDFTVEVYQTVNSVDKLLETHLVSKETKKDARGRQLYLEEVINNNSLYIRVIDNKDVTTAPKASGSNVSLTGGANDSSPATNNQITAAYDLFKDKKYPIGILMSAGHSSTSDNVIHNKIISVASSRGDTFAILDTPQSVDTASEITSFVATQAANSSRAANYGPYLYCYDLHNDLRNVLVPPSGAVGGNFAITKSQYPIGAAPFGSTNRGVVSSESVPVTGIAATYTEGELESIINADFNPIIYRNNQLVVWGQRTTLNEKTSALSRANVALSVDFVVNGLDSYLQNVIAVDNTADTRSVVEDEANSWLDTNVVGTAAYVAFAVCNESNNPPAVIDRNELVVTVQMQPTRTSEYILLEVNLNSTS